MELISGILYWIKYSDKDAVGLSGGGVYLKHDENKNYIIGLYPHAVWGYFYTPDQMRDKNLITILGVDNPI